ncbi:MAG: DUF4136 domain-containing protein [Planctomycetota bacterium]
MRTISFRLAPVILGLFTAACQTSQREVEVPRSSEFEKYETYSLALPVSVLESGLSEDLSGAIEDALPGLLRVESDPQLWVTPSISTERRTREEDAYFAHNVASLREIGILTLDFADAGTEESVWRVRGEGVLRTISRASGLSGKMIPTEEEPVWPFAEMVPKMLHP